MRKSARFPGMSCRRRSVAQDARRPRLAVPRRRVYALWITDALFAGKTAENRGLWIVRGAVAQARLALQRVRDMGCRPPCRPTPWG
jgi:hypothetical protein